MEITVPLSCSIQRQGEGKIIALSTMHHLFPVVIRINLIPR
jgi:hypothetical protein